MIHVADVDKRICDIEPETDNSETYREFIFESEEEFDLEHVDVDNMSDEELTTYVARLDYLWEK